MRARARAALVALVACAVLAPATPGGASSCRAARATTAAPARIGLVFAGGGAKAAYEAGLALALEERGLVPAAVAGTSSGALNAAMVAAGETDALAALWRSVRREDVFDYRARTVFGGLLPGWLALPVLRGAASLLDPAPLRRTIAAHLDLARVRTSAVRLLVLAADLVAGEPRRFDNETVTVDALVASATVPGLFPPVAIDDALLVDGGIVQRAPILELLDTVPLDRLVVVLGYGDEGSGASSVEPTVRGALERAFEIALSREILRDAELARFRHPGVDVQVVRPSQPLDVRPLDFDGARLGHLVDLGRADGLACLDALGPAR